ncbi:hypothetical protein FBF27_01735 [Candidatus Saccharibacteria bacterium oral taxon 488]|nr:hypothetical protein FBF27_01735 [Candidatus Saccharibacteria bacterium oral taxon 488]
MVSRKTYCLAAIFIAAGVPFVLANVALAAPAGVSNVENFIRSVIQVVAGLAGLVATGFFVAGGFTYITSSGNPEQLDKAKRTITWSAIGLAIVIAAFVLANIVTTLARQAFGG